MAEPSLILLVEDDPEIRVALRDALSGAGYLVADTDGVKAGLHLLRTRKPALLVLDLNLPDGDGLEICRAVRGHKTLRAVPVILLTGRGELDEKGQGFAAGADHYLVKPVVPRELLLWVDALLRRRKLDAGPEAGLEAGDLALEPGPRRALYQGQPIAGLSDREFDLLCLLVRRRPRVLDRGELVAEVWGGGSSEHAVDNALSRLRAKLPPDLARRLQTVPGKGVRFLDQPGSVK